MSTRLGWFELESGQLPTEPVGSLPRPARLQHAVLAQLAGSIDEADLQQEYDAAVKDTVDRFVATGSPIITDGEQRRNSFASYPVAPGTATASEVFAVYADGHHRLVPKLTTSQRFSYASYAGSDVEYVRKLTDLPVKEAVVSPAMLSLMYPDSGLDGYSKAEFEEDVIAGSAADIISCFAAGASRVHVDFTEGRLALNPNSQVAWAGTAALHGFIELLNRVLDAIPEQYRPFVGVHTCPGNDLDSSHSRDVDYAKLLPELFQIEAGYFLVQAAGEENPDRVANLVGQQLKQLGGARQPRILLGVTNPTSPRLETAEEIADQLVKASRFIPAELLGSTDDCGFSPYLVDSKPRHGSPEFARDVAFAKIAARVQGTAIASETLLG